MSGYYRKHCNGGDKKYQMVDGVTMTLCIFHSNSPNVFKRNDEPVLSEDFEKQDRVSALREFLNVG